MLKNIKKINIIFSIVLLIVMIFSASVMVYTEDIDHNYEFEYLNTFDKTKPFFENAFEEIVVDNTISVDPYYDKFPVIENHTTFMGKGSIAYENINGKTVLVEALFRKRDEAVDDPNYSMGLMLYRCILYKIANPEANVSISFSSYRMSPTIAVCLKPESKFYGYCKALYDSDYDQYGFVRIVYLLTEAARMGIDVTIVGQLNSYAVKQYVPSTGKLKSKAEPSFATYINKALKSECYDKYASGKKVSNYMRFVMVKWPVDDKGSVDMMHTKACAVSNYIDIDNVEHGPAVWFSSTNLDTVNYKGANGNNGSQSGVIVSDHEKIYNITKNYINLIYNYSDQEDSNEMRDFIRNTNEKQTKLILSGKEDEIPEDEQLIYLGSENDNVFELYFTPVANADFWDTVGNPYCKYFDAFYKNASNGYIELAWNCPTFTVGSELAERIQNIVEKAFLENKNKKNTLQLRLPTFRIDNLQTLVAGKDIRYIKLSNAANTAHEKDVVMSYVDEYGNRQYISLLSSCNFHAGAFGYQTNQMLVINENSETGNKFYKLFGNETSSGAIK